MHQAAEVRYLAAQPEERGHGLLDDLAELTRLHPKSLVRLLGWADPEQRRRTRQHGRAYGARRMTRHVPSGRAWTMCAPSD